MVEVCRTHIQLRVLPLRRCHSAHCMRKVSRIPNIQTRNLYLPTKQSATAERLGEEISLDDQEQTTDNDLCADINRGSLPRKMAGTSMQLNVLLLMMHGLTLQIFGCARSNIYLLNDHLNKREWTYIFGACCMMTIFIPSFRNYRIWSFFGLIMITYTAWYMTIASVYYGQVTGPNPPQSSSS